MGMKPVGFPGSQSIAIGRGSSGHFRSMALKHQAKVYFPALAALVKIASAGKPELEATAASFRILRTERVFPDIVLMTRWNVLRCGSAAWATSYRSRGFSHTSGCEHGKSR